MPVRNPISKNQKDGIQGWPQPSTVCVHMDPHESMGEGEGKKDEGERERENLAKNFFAE